MLKYMKPLYSLRISESSFVLLNFYPSFYIPYVAGKTMQIVSFIDVFMSLHTTAVGTATPISTKARVLCIVPINTIQNWLAEFNHWLPSEVRNFIA